jgi:hypothetical protein
MSCLLSFAFFDLANYLLFCIRFLHSETKQNHFMNKLFTLLLLMTFSFASMAINPVKDTNPTKPSTKEAIETGKQAIDNELEALMAIEKVVREEKIDYTELQTKHAELAKSATLSPAVDDGILDGSPDSPLGIPGFWWGFCLGWVGLVIIYVSMDEGADRKEQVKNGLYGCVAWVVIWSVMWFAVFAASTT